MPAGGKYPHIPELILYINELYDRCSLVRRLLALQTHSGHICGYKNLLTPPGSERRTFRPVLVAGWTEIAQLVWSRSLQLPVQFRVITVRRLPETLRRKFKTIFPEGVGL